MKCVLLESPRNFVMGEAEVPDPKPGEALLKVRKVGICGADVQMFQLGHVGGKGGDRPFVTGHECVGEVIEVGEGVDEDLIGRRVAVDPTIPCGECEWCVRGVPNVCPRSLFLGHLPAAGAMQQYLAHPVDLLARLPDAVSDEAGVMFEPLAIAYHALNLVKIQPGQSVCILGTAVLGSCVLELLSLYEGLHITCVDLLPDRLERARRMGADAVVRPEGKGVEQLIEQVREAVGERGADVVFECAGVDQTQWAMCEVAAPAAHLAVIGCNPADRVTFSAASARRKGLTLRFVRRSLHTLHTCVDFTARGIIDPGALVTHTFPAREVNRAFEIVERCEDGVLKAVLDFEDL
ncbi:MAG: zinc-dependent alcohol dehydrogenase [Planctomycetota bacterium]